MPTCGVTRRRGGRSRRRSVPLVVELGKGGAQLLALRVEVDEDAREPAFAIVRQAEVGDARIGLGLLALDQSCPLGSADELGYRALRRLQSLGELGDRCLFAA